jgi:uncharacterized protein
MDHPQGQACPLLIDSNIFLEFLLNQPRSEESIALMQAIERGDLTAYVTSFALHSIEVILDRFDEHLVLDRFLVRVTEAQGLSIYPTSPEEERGAVDVTMRLPLDFDDSLQYYVATTLNLTLVSFDHDFDRTNIERVEPLQAIKQ